VVKATNVVVGDILIIESGMKVPADCVIISGIDILVDDSRY
jgi:magnesium-transporting ATPase (P-type)